MYYCGRGEGGGGGKKDKEVEAKNVPGTNKWKMRQEKIREKGSNR